MSLVSRDEGHHKHKKNTRVQKGKARLEKVGDFLLPWLRSLLLREPSPLGIPDHQPLCACSSLGRGVRSHTVSHIRRNEAHLARGTFCLSLSL